MENYSEQEYFRLYKKLLELHRKTGTVHAGGSISILPVLYILFSGLFDEKKDMLVYSKGHTVFALYCVLALRGFISESEIETCCLEGARLGAHHPKNLVPFSPFATGSLGHGASLASGLALGKKLTHEDGRVFCICGDGEFQEGSCWEAINFCTRQKLDNLTIIIDCNKWQGFGAVKDIAGYDAEGLRTRLATFRADVKSCDVHDHDKLFQCLNEKSSDTPSIIIVHSVKGEGLGKYEDTLECHYLKITEEISENAGCRL